MVGAEASSATDRFLEDKAVDCASQLFQTFQRMMQAWPLTLRFLEEQRQPKDRLFCCWTISLFLSHHLGVLGSASESPLYIVYKAVDCVSQLF